VIFTLSRMSEALNKGSFDGSEERGKNQTSKKRSREPSPPRKLQRVESPDQITMVDSDQEKTLPVCRTVPPPTTPITDTLFIVNFVRPFPVPSLKQLLSDSDRVKITNFWLNDIRSYCFVTFSTKEEAIKCREQVHNIVWPALNHGKPLETLFVSREYAQSCIDSKTKPDISVIASFGTEKPKTDNGEKTSEDTTVTVVNEKKYVEPLEKAQSTSKGEQTRKQPWSPQRLSRAPEKPHSQSPPREKLEKFPATPTSSRNNHLSSSIGNSSRNEDRAQQPPPLRVLSELFLKTDTEPVIYYLPLTDSQVKEKRERQQQQREEPQRYEPPDYYHFHHHHHFHHPYHYYAQRFNFQ